jgi:hypothetical protein
MEHLTVNPGPGEDDERVARLRLELARLLEQSVEQLRLKDEVCARIREITTYLAQKRGDDRNRRAP